MAWASIVLLLLLGSHTAGNEVVIRLHRLEPPILGVLPNQRVRFINESGRDLHIDFIGDAKQHHVFGVRDSIWAIFHGEGRHPYTVHFDDQRGGVLRGVIDVTQERPSELPPTCPTVTVMGVCLDP